MEGWKGTRSMPVVVGVIAVLAIGVICLYALPVYTTKRNPNFGEPGTSEKYGDVKPLMDLAGGGWANDLARVGLVVAVAAAVAFPRSRRALQALLITGGSIAAMAVPFWLARHKERDSLGAGAIAAWIAFAVAAVLPWVLMRFDEASVATAGTGSGATSPPLWMLVDSPTLLAAMHLSPAFGAPGTSVEATLSGFTAGSRIAVRWPTGESLAEVNASPEGTAVARFLVPPTANAGRYAVEASNTGGGRTSVMFDVTQPVA